MHFGVLKMKLSLVSVALAAGLGLAAIGAHASDGTITINGMVSAQTCTISGEGQGKDFTVTLPAVSTSALAVAGSTAGTTTFNIALTNCSPADHGTASIYLESGVNTLADGNLKNAAASGATGVEVQMLNGIDMTPMDASKGQYAQNSPMKFIVGGAANLPFAAQYVAPAGNATAGDVTTTVTYSIGYD